jgi:hypothetical protein
MILTTKEVEYQDLVLNGETEKAVALEKRDKKR